MFRHAISFARKLSYSECDRAQNLLVEYCKEFEKRYSQENVVINMHLACHLKECIIDYGPVHEFWCFRFERFNGFLGSYLNNHQNISIAMMKRFEDYLQSSKYNDLDIELQLLLSEVSNSEVTGSLIDSCDNNILLKPLREYILTAEYHKNSITSSIQMLQLSLHYVCTRSSKMLYMGHILLSTLARSKSGTCIATYLNPREPNSRPHIGLVNFYFEHIIQSDWASEASPTLGCSIEISRDIIYMLSVCRMSVVCQINCIGGITWPTRMLKVFWGRLNQ